MRALPVRRAALRPPVALVALAAGLALGLLVWPAPSFRDSAKAPAPPSAGYTPSHPLIFYDARAFAAAAAATAASPVRLMPDARGLIVPHHWVGGRFITTPLRDLAASRHVNRVILLGPNHVNAGSATVLTSDRPWETPFGPAGADRTAVGTLTATGLVRSEPEVLTYEHSVAGIVPALRRYLPEAEVVPLVLRGGLAPTEIERLAAALAPLVDEGTVVVAAVDFSHGLPAADAGRRDGETLAALRASDWTRVVGWGNEHLDSPAAVALLMETMGRLGAGRFELTDNSNSGEVSGDFASPVTSYIVGYFH